MSREKLFEMMQKVNPGFVPKAPAPIEEDYPESFDMDKFKSLTSFAQRVRYCEEHLERVSSGSGRVVYKVDDSTVLKLAKNRKGVAQNQIESDWFIQDKYDDIVTRYIDGHPDDLWNEMELAQKARPTMFQQYLGFSFKDLMEYIALRDPSSNPDRIENDLKNDPEKLEEMDNHEWVFQLMDLVGNFDMPVGDLTRISSYGVVNREGRPTIVLTDFGLTRNVYNNHYKR